MRTKLKLKRAFSKKANARLSVLYLPNELINQRNTKFRSFRNLRASLDFTALQEKNYPVDNVQNITKRLNINLKSSRNFIKYSKSEQKKAVKKAVNLLNDWDYRNSIMPKMKIMKRVVQNSDSNSYLPSIMDQVSVKHHAKIRTYSKEKRFKKIREVELIWRKISQLFPLDSREGCTFTYSNGKGWLIGGIGERVVSKIVSFDPKTKEFEKIKAEKCSRMPRFNHTALAYNK